MGDKPLGQEREANTKDEGGDALDHNCDPPSQEKDQLSGPKGEGIGDPIEHNRLVFPQGSESAIKLTTRPPPSR